LIGHLQTNKIRKALPHFELIHGVDSLDLARDIDRISDAVAGFGSEDRHTRLTCDHLQLVNGIRALKVGGDEQRRVTLALELERKLSRKRCLAGTLQAGEQDHGRRILCLAQSSGLAAENCDELLVHDLDDLLSRIQGAGNLYPESALLDCSTELADNRQGNIGFEQGRTDLTNRGIDVSLGESTFAAQTLEGRRQPIGEIREHVVKATGYARAA
jgi:hypothetical protein